VDVTQTRFPERIPQEISAVALWFLVRAIYEQEPALVKMIKVAMPGTETILKPTILGLAEGEPGACWLMEKESTESSPSRVNIVYDPLTLLVNAMQSPHVAYECYAIW
jgi:hypothetical protein